MNGAKRKFLIVKMSAMGDIVHTLPALRSLREKYPGAFIAWVVEDRFKDLLHNNPDLDEVIAVSLKRWRRNVNLASLREFWSFVRNLRKHKFDTLLDFQGLIKSGLVALIAGVPNRIGFHRDDCRERLNGLFTNRKAPAIGRKTHVVDKNLALLKLAGVDNFTIEFPLNLPASAEQSAADYLDANPELTAKPVVGVHCGVGFKTKTWELERFAQLSDRIANELGCNILLTWGPGERGKVDALSARIKQRHWIAPANSLPQAIALFKRLDLLVSCDTGPAHVCAAFQVPTVSIHGPTDPEYSRPRDAIHAVVYKIQPCSFCHKRSCPTQNECMTSISVDDVFQAVQKSVAKHVRIAGTENPLLER